MSMYGQQQLAYAPTPYSYTPSSNLTATINLDEEVKLADTAAERDLYESLAEIYSIIVTLEALEKAYLRDSIKESEYTETCDRLLRQYKSNLAADSVQAAFGDLESFKAEWGVRCPVVPYTAVCMKMLIKIARSAQGDRTSEDWPASNH